MVNVEQRIDVNGVVKYFRDNIELEKGVILSEERIKNHRVIYEKYSQFFSAYPDLYLDIIKPSDSNFELFFY